MGHRHRKMGCAQRVATAVVVCLVLCLQAHTSSVDLEDLLARAQQQVQRELDAATVDSQALASKAITDMQRVYFADDALSLRDASGSTSVDRQRIDGYQPERFQEVSPPTIAHDATFNAAVQDLTTLFRVAHSASASASSPMHSAGKHANEQAHAVDEHEAALLSIREELVSSVSARTGGIASQGSKKDDSDDDSKGKDKATAKDGAKDKPKDGSKDKSTDGSKDDKTKGKKPKDDGDDDNAGSKGKTKDSGKKKSSGGDDGGGSDDDDENTGDEGEELRQNKRTNDKDYASQGLAKRQTLKAQRAQADRDRKKKQQVEAQDDEEEKMEQDQEDEEDRKQREADRRKKRKQEAEERRDNDAKKKKDKEAEKQRKAERDEDMRKEKEEKADLRKQEEQSDEEDNKQKAKDKKIEKREKSDERREWQKQLDEARKMEIEVDNQRARDLQDERKRKILMQPTPSPTDGKGRLKMTSHVVINTGDGKIDARGLNDK